MKAPPSLATILIVEDEEGILEALASSLGKEGYECLQARDGLAGLKLATERQPDLVLLDLMLPGMDGLSVCRRIRQASKVPILMLTARDGETDKILGLETGADDYVTKPFSIPEVKARIRSLLRRSQDWVEKPAEDGVIEVGHLRIDKVRHEVTVHGKPVELTSTEFDLLHCLASSPGRVFRRDDLLELVWGYTFEGYGRTVDSHVTRLRKKVEDDPKNPELLLTVYKVGYKFREGDP